MKKLAAGLAGRSDGARVGKHELTVALGGMESNQLACAASASFLLEPVARAQRKGGFYTLQASYTAPTATAVVEGSCFSSDAALLTGPISVAQHLNKVEDRACL